MKFLTRDPFTPPSALQMWITTSTSSRAATSGWCRPVATPASRDACRHAGLASPPASTPAPGPSSAASCTSSKVGEVWAGEIPLGLQGS